MQFQKSKIRKYAVSSNFSNHEEYPTSTFTQKRRPQVFQKSQVLRYSPMNKEDIVNTNESNEEERNYETNNENINSNNIIVPSLDTNLRSPKNYGEYYTIQDKRENKRKEIKEVRINSKQFDKESNDGTQDYSSNRINNTLSNLGCFNITQSFRPIKFDSKVRESRSPKTINIGETAEEVEYNMKKITQGGRSPRISNINSPILSPDTCCRAERIDRTYAISPDQPGNLPLKGVQQRNLFNKGEVVKTPVALERNICDQNKSNDDPNFGSFATSREMPFNLNPREHKGRDLQTQSKMSPTANVDGDSDSNSEKNAEAPSKDLKSQMDKNVSVSMQIQGQNAVTKEEDGIIVEGTKPLENDLEKIENYMKKTQKENVTEDEVKKFVRYYVKGYNPNKEGDGRLISACQTVVAGSTGDDMIGERFKVLQKMKKLSSVLLAKRNNDDDGLTSQSSEVKFDKNTLNSSTIRGLRDKKRNKKSNKFLYVSLAMLSSKGLNTEDRIIVRRMRNDKGGVVDLAQEKAQKNKTKFKIKKVQHGGSKSTTMINPKYKEKAAKIVQSWWREQKNKYKKILDQIIKIQSVWRGKWIRKYVYDIIYVSYMYQNLFERLGNVLASHVRPYVFEELFARQKWAKLKLSKILTEKDHKFSLLRIRSYFHKWFIISNFLRNRLLKSEQLIIKKNDNQKKLKVLRTFFHHWVTKVRLINYINKAENAEAQKQKLYAVSDLFNSLNYIGKQKYFDICKDNIKDYLKKNVLYSLLTGFIISKAKNEERINKQICMNKWRQIVHKTKFSDLKTDVLSVNMSRIFNKIDLNKKRFYFNIWRKVIPGAKNVFSVKEGTEILQRFMWRNTFIDPYNALIDKIKENNQEDSLYQILKIKRQNNKNILDSFMNKWKRQVLKMTGKDEKNYVLQRLITVLMAKRQSRILYKKFNQWRQRPKMNINKELGKFNSFEKIFKKICNKTTINDKFVLIKYLKLISDKVAKNCAGGKFIKKYNMKDNKLMKFYLYRWRAQTKELEIAELKQKMFQYLIKNRETREHKINISKYFHRWKLFVGDGKSYDNMLKLKRVIKGIDLLHTIKQRRGLDLYIRLYRKMNKDFRPILISKLFNKFSQPKTTLRECLMKWKILNDKQKAAENIRTLKGKYIYHNIRSTKKRTKRDELMKAFFRWRVLSRKPNEYYPKILHGCKLLRKYLIFNHLPEVFDLIHKRKNLNRPLNNILKNYKYEEKRILDGKLRNLFGRWRKITQSENVLDLKTNILVKTKKNRIQNANDKLLAKFFTRWKLYRRKGLDVNFTKGLDLIKNHFRKPLFKDLILGFKIKTEKLSKQNRLNQIGKIGEDYKRNLLHKTLLKWYRKAAKIDPNKSRRIKNKLRRIIIHQNEYEPKAKAFRCWARQVKFILLREKDIAKARRILINSFKNNDRANMHYAVGRWKNKIHEIREQYLKSLLLKQIKSAQIIKEEMTNQSRLRAALLKWRTKISPLNYLDRLKQIRKGCKIFKKGLKLRDARTIFDGVKEKSIENYKIFILKKGVEFIRPNFNLNICKKYFDIWRSKVPDTMKMKRKMFDILEDYLMSNKLHNGLIAKPKDELLAMFKSYNDLKNRSKALCLLKALMKKKEKNIEEKKKILLYKFNQKGQILKNHENAKVIQKFMRNKLNKLLKRKEEVLNGLDHLKKGLKLKIIQKMYDAGRQNYINTFLLKYLGFKGVNANIVQQHIFGQWLKNANKIKENEAATKINNWVRIYQSKQKVNNLRRRLVLLKSITERHCKKDIIKLYSKYYDWNYRTNKIISLENANIIQMFCKQKLNERLRDLAQTKFKNIFYKNIHKRISFIIERSSRIIGGKGEVLYKSIQDILYRTPFDNLIQRLQFLSKVKALSNLYPKIKFAMEKKYLPGILSKWKSNTYDDTVRKCIKIQTFLRQKRSEIYVKKQLRINELLNKLINKKEKDLKFKQMIPFNIWNKKAKLLNAIDGVTKIQSSVRILLAKKKAKLIKARNSLENIFKKKLISELFNVFGNAGNYKILQEQRRFALIKIINQKQNGDDQNLLKYSINKWKCYNQKYLMNVNKIQNAFRCYLANKEKKRLIRINYLLSKYVAKHIVNDKDKMRTALRKFYGLTKFGQVDNSSRIIQNFIRPKLAKLFNKKFRNFFYKNGRLIINKKVIEIVRIYKLQKCLNRPSLNKFINNFKTIAKNDKIKNKLITLINNKNNKLNTILADYYLGQWNDRSKFINNKEHNSALKIQCAFRMFLAKKEANKLRRIKEILTKTIINKSKMEGSLLFSSFTKWQNIINGIRVNENARIIQQFCREILERTHLQQLEDNQNKIISGLIKFFMINFNKKYFFDKLKSKNNKFIFSKFNETMKEHRRNTIKDVFQKIKQSAFNNHLTNVVTLIETFKERIIKNNLKKWNENTTKINKKLAASLIQKNFRYFLIKKKYEKRQQILVEILSKVYKKQANAQSKYLSIWKIKAAKQNALIMQSRIVKYIVNKYKITKARNNWTKLINKCTIQHRNKGIFDVIKRLEYLKKLNKLKCTLSKIAKNTFFTEYKESIRKTKIIQILKKGLPEWDYHNNNNLVYYYLKKWIIKNNKLAEREDKLRNAAKEINKRYNLNALDLYNNISLIKNFNNCLPVIRAKEFYKRIKNISQVKNKSENLADDLINIQQSIHKQENHKIIDKIYKLYYYKILNKFCNACQVYDKKKIQPKIFSLFIEKLRLIKTNKAMFNYEGKKEYSAIPKSTKFSFKTTQNVQSKSKGFDNKARIKKLIPGLVHYLDNKMNSRKAFAFTQFKNFYASRKFCILLRDYSIKKSIEPKKEMLDELKRNSEYNSTIGDYQAKLFKLLRKKYILQLVSSLDEPQRVYKILYLFNVTNMHKNIAAQRFQRELIRKWRFQTFTKKIARKKLELMYKNMHVSYLQMANDFFGEEAENPSVIKEFERFGADLGMFTNEDAKVNEEMAKKYYQTVEKKYIFSNKENNEEPRNSIKKTQNVIKTVVVTKEEIKEEDYKNVANPKKTNAKKGGYKNKQ